MNKNKESKTEIESENQNGYSQNADAAQPDVCSSAATAADDSVKNEKETAAQNDAPSAGSAADTEGAEAASAQPNENEELKTRVTALEKENTELKDQYLRKVADFDNYRKRMMREKQEAFDYANTNILTDLVAVLDDFDRAIASAEQSAGTSPEALALVDGIKMINKQMYGLLEAKYNLASYGAAGDIFDHDNHEAIASVPASVAEPVCAEVYLRGYMLKNRVIRHAKVLVHMPDGSAQ